MARAAIKLYTTLKDKIGTSRVEVDADTAARAIRFLREKYPDIVNATLVDPNGIVRNQFVLTLNSQVLDPNRLDDVKLKAGDLLHIFPPIAGGVVASLPRHRCQSPAWRGRGDIVPLVD